MDTEKKLSGLTIALHWLVALSILTLCGVGIYMVQSEAWPLYHIHKSIGLLIFALIIARVAWRLLNGLPKPVREFSRFEHLAAKTVHWLLLLGTLAMPLTGMLFSGASGHGFGIFSWEIFPANYAPDKPGQAIPLSAAWSDLGQALHGYLGYLLLALIVLHVAGALKHHILDKDHTLSRMLGRRAE
ncbi:cytochrome b [Pseudoduganella violacea]|uniref:Cytochrome b561 n=1 Tax=Pseudoduganella violacea TaxID=1715466 RepID=A0A7W5FSB9_9BURK|nr:cytochrome b [Pseudoduganella violacea]MBB3117575.1 cytochrome b561 [Pseudoduganella violacea]